MLLKAVWQWHRTNTSLVAIDEIWGNHCEYIFTTRHYGNGGVNGTFAAGGFTALLQGRDWENVAGGLNCNMNAIENFNPRIGTGVDPYQWIPQGICYDLNDNRNDFNFNVNLPVDNVAGYTNQQCYNALQADVRSIPAFRNRLLQQNSNNQAANVTDLFLRYGFNILKRLVLITIPVFSLLSFQCNKNGTAPCPNFQTAYSFAVTSEWAPQTEVYNVGDTIFVISSVPKTLTDQISSISVDYSNAVIIGGGIGLGYLDTITKNVIPSRNKFDFFALAGNIEEAAIAPDQGPTFSYSELSTSYYFKFGFICRQKGIYMISVSDLKSPGLKGKNCTNAGFEMTLTNNEKHFALYEYALGFPNDAVGKKEVIVSEYNEQTNSYLNALLNKCVPLSIYFYQPAL